MLRAPYLASLGILSVLGLSISARAEPRKPTHIACVGDSITAGAGASSTAKNYVSLLQGLEGNAVQVKNFGRSGATMLSEGFGDLPYEKQTEYADATTFVANAPAGAVVSVIIVLGANDSKSFNWEPNGMKRNEQFLKDYRAMVEHFAGLPSKPVVYVGYPLATGTNPCCSIRGDVISEQQLPLIKQLAMEKHLPIVDLNTATTNHPEYFGDGVHPNDAGYVVMANLVKKGLDREPKVSITAPSMGGSVPSGMVALTAEVDADYVDVTSVEFFEGATSLGKATAKPFTVSFAATAGMHQITAKAVDATLASGTSAMLTFTAIDGAGGSAGGAGASAGGAAGGGGSAGSSVAGAAGSGMGGVAGNPGVAGAAASGAPAGGAPAGGAPTSPSSSGNSNSDSSCGCVVAGGERSSAAWLVAALGLTALGRRRRAPFAGPRSATP
jgi:acyl-CoA thioesterase I